MASSAVPLEWDCIPTFWRRLLHPDVQTILLTGVGGGFGFCHTMLLYPTLVQAGKKIVIGSYSFGDPNRIQGGEILATHPVTHRPQSCYAYYARDFTVPLLTGLYSALIEKHDIDAIVCMDGGSDSLMAGDEKGLSDAVTITTVAKLGNPRLKAKILIAIGVGCDRFNAVSDGASLRAMAELRARGGFLGSMAMESNSKGVQFYNDCIEYLQRTASFRSVISNSIVESAKGAYGSEFVPPQLQRRVQPGELFLWPLMSELFAFDPVVMVERSLYCQAIADCRTVGECYQILPKNSRKASVRRETPPCGETSGTRHHIKEVGKSRRLLQE